MTVNILGTPYEIILKKYEDDKTFEELSCDGYSSGYDKKIVVCDMKTHPDWEGESDKACKEATNQTIRHEIVHVFFDESGLKDSVRPSAGSWARNEEMVDWIAIQGAKIHKAWQEADAL